MDCLPMDTVCVLQNDYEAYTRELVIEDDLQENTFVLGEFNGRTYRFSQVNGEYMISVESKSKASPPEVF